MSKQCTGQTHLTQAADSRITAVCKGILTEHECVSMCMCVYNPNLGKKLLLCTGRACGEVKTLRAHPVWDSACPVVVPLTPKH